MKKSGTGTIIFDVIVRDPIQFNTMRSLFRILLLASLLYSASFAQAQCPSFVDISLRPNQNDQIEVWLRPEADFDDVFASISFTIRWMDGQADLGSVSQEMTPYMNLGTSGPTHIDGIYKYQIYAGFGFVPLSTNGAMWVAGEELLLTRIDVINGSSFFEISDDDFTAANNGLYYISLNGEVCTGEIYTFSTGLVGAGTPLPEVSITPNPSSGNTSISIELDGTADLEFELYDPAGRRIWQQSRASRSGQHIEQLDLRDLSSGVYMLHLRIGDRMSTHRIVLSSDVR